MKFLSSGTSAKTVRFLSIVILLALILATQFSVTRADEEYQELELGVYDPCPSPSCDPSTTLQKLRELGANAILVTLVDGDGLALYPSKVLPVNDEMVPITLATIRTAKQLGFRVYGWVNIPHRLWLGRHPEWIAVLSNGRPSNFYKDDYFQAIVSPARVVNERECVDLIREMFREAASLSLDGVDVNDNFQFSDAYSPEEDRYLLTSYDRYTVEMFEEDTGINVPGSSPQQWASFIEDNEEVWRAWVEWRASKVTKLIEIISEAMKEVNPSLEIRPHLLIWDPLETYGLDYPALAGIADTLYVMVPGSESRTMHYRAVRMAKSAGARRVIASTYLVDLLGEDDPIEEARKRARWLASAGADGIFVYWEGVDEERYDMMRAIFDEFSRIKALRSPEWLRGARIVSLYVDPSYPEGVDLVRLRDQGVSVIELDAGLSDYDNLYGSGFNKALGIVKSIASEAHSLGMKVVIYVPALEVISHGEFDHIDWLQESLSGRKLIVRGAELDVPWLSPDDIALWLSPYSPHREIIAQRIRELIGAGADGVWLDVPHMPSYLTEDMQDLWPDASEWGAKRFREEYGMDPPSSPDDNEFWAWLKWRHEATVDFVLEMADVAYEAGGVLMVESSACDHGGTELAYDPTLLRDNPLVVQVPEIGPVSWERGLLGASFEEWAHFYAMLKHARASNPEGLVIPLTYGGSEVDSSKQLGLIVSIADGYFETNSGNGLMVGTVGIEYRRKAFRFVSMLSGLGRQRASVGVLFSRTTRDLVDMYVAGPYDVQDTTHMRAFREVVKLLAEKHIQFDVLPIEEVSPDELANYEVLIAPEVRCLSQEARRMLSSYRGQLLVLGELGSLDDMGNPTEELTVGKRINLGELPNYLPDPLVDGAKGLIIEEFGSGGCRVLAFVNITAGRGSIRVPNGWMMRFDNMAVMPVSNEVEVPFNFLLLFMGDDGGKSELRKAMIKVPSPVDRRWNFDVISRFNGTATAFIRVGGPQVDPEGWKGMSFAFVRENGVYRELKLGNATYRAIYGSEDYAIIWRVKCGSVAFFRVAGITRFGTRAGLMWLLSKGVEGELTLIRWVDDGDGAIELDEISSIPWGYQTK